MFCTTCFARTQHTPTLLFIHTHTPYIYTLSSYTLSIHKYVYIMYERRGLSGYTLYYVLYTHTQHTHTEELRQTDYHTNDYFCILGIGSTCCGILANLISLMWEIQYMLHFNLPELLRACVVCVKKKVVISVLVVSSLSR